MKFFICFFVILLIIFLWFSFKKHDDKSTSNQNIEVSSTIENEPEPKEDININMSVIGDVMCHNSQYNDAYNSSTNTYDFSYVFENIKKYIEPADIAIGNLETTFAGSKVGYSNYPRFNTPEQLATNLKDLGIDVLSTANNHSLDTNYSGLVSTLDYLDKAGISHMGTYTSEEAQNTILVKDINGIKIAFLAFTYGTNGIPVPKGKEYCINLIDEAFILEQLNLAKEQNPDLICVNMHWGIEYQTKQNSEQEDLADLLFNNGVDIIFGSHPHVLQPMEKRTVTLEDGSTKDCFVIYSLGNFISGQNADNTRNSAILNISITKDGETEETYLNSVSYVPIYMYRASSGTKRFKVLDIEQSISDYESGSNSALSQSTISTLRTELKKIRNTLGDNIEF